jgi:acetate---CoA ligase (ADP-forming)
VGSPEQVSPGGKPRFEERDDIAAAAAVGHVLQPASVAVIGASRRTGSIGGAVVRNLVAGGFTGELYPVNPHARTIAGRRAFASVRDVPGSVELAVVAVSAAGVADAARDCAAKGVRALVVLSAGFGEIGPEGRALQDEVLGICRDAGMRMVGPNCLGVLNTDRLRLAERCIRHRGTRARGATWTRAVLVRLDGRQGRSLGQRLPALLGA